jgi:uroporphyrinogen III methyltransferase / synthase
MELTGKTVVVTRASKQSAELRDRLESSGARVIECPTIRIVPPQDWTLVDEAVRRIDSYQWLLFTSANAVDRFMARIESLPCKVQVAVVGSATASKVTEWDLKPALVPREFSAEGLLEAFPQDMAGTRILFPRAETARELLPEELRRRGAVVDIVTVYRTIRAESGDLQKILTAHKVDCVVFTSPSTIPDHIGRLPQTTAVAVIGPVTREAAQLAGLQPVIEPAEATVAALVSAIRSYFQS